jgi:hypothetical protein
VDVRVSASPDGGQSILRPGQRSSQRPCRASSVKSEVIGDQGAPSQAMTARLAPEQQQQQQPPPQRQSTAAQSPPPPHSAPGQAGSKSAQATSDACQSLAGGAPATPLPELDAPIAAAIAMAGGPGEQEVWRSATSTRYPSIRLMVPVQRAGGQAAAAAPQLLTPADLQSALRESPAQDPPTQGIF